MRIRTLNRPRTDDLTFVRVAMIYPAVITLAALTTAFIHPIVGMVAYTGILGSLVLYAAHNEDRWQRAFLLSITLIPISRIVALGMPDDALPEQWEFLLTSLPLLGASYMAARVTGLTRRDIGLRFPSLVMWLPTIVVAGSGIVIGAIAYEYSILRPPGTSSSFEPDRFIAASMALALVTGLTEEVVFRGIIQATTVKRVLRTTAGIFYVSALYGVLHISHRADAGAEFVLFDALFAFTVGLYFAAVTYLTRSLVGVIVAHSLITATLLVGIPVLWD